MTIVFKAGAYLVEGSIGPLSDALASLVDRVAAIVALVTLTVGAREPNDEHAYGYEKVKYFSSGTESS